MRLKAITGASAILWCASMFIIGLVHLWAPSYGTGFLQMMSSLYPGYHATGGFWNVVFGAVYGLVDGAIAGFVFGVLYLWFSPSRVAAANPVSQDQPSGAVPLRRAS
jgi:hypothetical protein